MSYIYWFLFSLSCSLEGFMVLVNHLSWQSLVKRSDICMMFVSVVYLLIHIFFELFIGRYNWVYVPNMNRYLIGRANARKRAWSCVQKVFYGFGHSADTATNWILYVTYFLLNFLVKIIEIHRKSKTKNTHTENQRTTQATTTIG